ncbi:MAG: 4Fe-4S dicluster domain-containing protein [Nitrososphaeria archaeon]|jgi:MinD superfamily P-loop ATPase
MQETSLAYWHGKERKTIGWYPTIDEEKCVGCGLCVVTCSERRNVFGYDPITKKAVVLYPYNCMVGCDNCRVACLWDAIHFPDPNSLKELAREIIDEGIIAGELRKKIATDKSLIL